MKTTEDILREKLADKKAAFDGITAVTEPAGTTTLHCGHATREEWLNDAADAIRGLFDEQSAPDYPKLRLSCGWPKGGRGKTIGQAWHPDSSGDSTVEIFISPALEKPGEVLETLVHELVHAVVGNDAGHRGPFKKLATGLGLEGKMTATHAGETLAATLESFLDFLGEYPHAELSKKTVTKQNTRMLKISCPNENCKFICRTTQKWLDEVGTPTCACGTEMEGPS